MRIGGSHQIQALTLAICDVYNCRMQILIVVVKENLLDFSQCPEYQMIDSFQHNIPSRKATIINLLWRD